MADDPVNLDKHRGMAAQRATEVRRGRSRRQESERVSSRDRHKEIDRILASAPAADWAEAAKNARFLIELLSGGSLAQDCHYRALMARVLQDIDNLAHADTPSD